VNVFANVGLKPYDLNEVFEGVTLARSQKQKSLKISHQKLFFIHLYVELRERKLRIIVNQNSSQCHILKASSTSPLKSFAVDVIHISFTADSKRVYRGNKHISWVLALAYLAYLDSV